MMLCFWFKFIIGDDLYNYRKNKIFADKECGNDFNMWLQNWIKIDLKLIKNLKNMWKMCLKVDFGVNNC